MVWNGMKGMDDVSLVANCATHPHDPSRTERMDPLTGGIAYDWAVRHR
jgi:dTDP-4-dehydrorhamnose 3,5-epimerase